MLVSDPELGFWCEPCMGWPGAARVAARSCRDTSCLAGLGWVPARQVCVAQKLAGRFPVVWRGIGEWGSLGRWAISLLTSARSSFLPGWECFGRGTGVDGGSTLAQLGFWRGPFALQVCQLPGTKNASLKRALLCMQPCSEPQLGWQKAAFSVYFRKGAISCPGPLSKELGRRTAHVNPASPLFLLPLTQQVV